MSNPLAQAFITLIESIEFDVNGDKLSGQGGHGGLVSNDTIKLCGEGRYLISQERGRRSSFYPIIMNMKGNHHDGNSNKHDEPEQCR